MHQHQQKHSRGRDTAKAPADNPSLPVLFYFPREHPYGCFCQWKETKLIVPNSALTWIKFAHPKHAAKTTSPEEEEGSSEFNCAEQFMMYCKALFFSDPESGEAIMKSVDPHVQKALGRKVKNWDEFLWRGVCERVVFEGNWWKFTQNGEYRSIMLGTGERELCEAAPNDRLWGIGYNAKQAMNYKRLWGQNLLGKALMRVREHIRLRMMEHEEFKRAATDWEMPETTIWEELRREREEKVERDVTKGRKLIRHGEKST